MKPNVTFHSVAPSQGWKINDPLPPTNTVSFSGPCVNLESYKAAKLVESWGGDASQEETHSFKKLAEDVDEARQSPRKIF